MMERENIVSGSRAAAVRPPRKSRAPHRSRSVAAVVRRPRRSRQDMQRQIARYYNMSPDQTVMSFPTHRWAVAESPCFV